MDPSRSSRLGGARSAKRRRPILESLSQSNEQPMSRDASDEDNTDSSFQAAATDTSVDEPLLKRYRSEDDGDEESVPTLPPGMEEKYGFKINSPPIGRPVRIYCDGIYDLFHFGHTKALEQAKRAFPSVYLLVGVCSDEETHKRKGKTVMTDVERYEAVRHCKWVDEVVTNAPWTVDQAFLDHHNIDYVAHDAEPYQSRDSGDVYAFVKDQGRFFPTERTDGISTSDLITRIVRDYDSFLRQNLGRGVSAKDLNISLFKEGKIKTKRSIEDFRKTVKTRVASVQDWLTLWEDKSHDFIRGFVGGISGAEDVMDKLWKRRNRLLENASPSSSCSNSRAQSEDEYAVPDSEASI